MSVFLDELLDTTNVGVGDTDVDDIGESKLSPEHLLLMELDEGDLLIMWSEAWSSRVSLSNDSMDSSSILDEALKLLFLAKGEILPPCPPGSTCCWGSLSMDVILRLMVILQRRTFTGKSSS